MQLCVVSMKRWFEEAKKAEKITGKRPPKPVHISSSSPIEAFEKYEKEVYSRIPGDLRKYLTKRPGMEVYMPISYETPLLGWVVFLVKDDVVVGTSTVHGYVDSLTRDWLYFGFEKDYDIMASEVGDNISKLLKIASRGKLAV